MNGRNDLVGLLGRILLSLLFIVSGFGKLMAAAATQAYFGKIGVPAPFVAYIIAVACELGGGVLFLLGVQTRIIALVLAAFTLGTALLGHSNFADMAQRTQFLKNLAIMGGFLGYALLGGGAYSVDGQMSRPARRDRIAA